MDLYHALNRGTDKRQVVMDERDRFRFVWSLYEMNDSQPVENTSRDRLFDLGGRTESTLKNRDRLVDVHAWCLMGNHYHLLLSDKVEGGVSKFLMKLNVGYTKYFNVKYKRSGVLFQGKTKRVLINTDRQYLYILPYIHLNPLDFLKGSENWRRQCPAEPNKALDFVTKYRWSSFRNYAGEPEFAEILEGSSLYQDKAMHVSALLDYLKSVPDTEDTALNLE